VSGVIAISKKCGGPVPIGVCCTMGGGGGGRCVEKIIVCLSGLY